MSGNCRFALDENRRVIDTVSVANSGKGYCHKGDPEDDKYLRERALMVRLGELIDKFLRPKQKLPSGEEAGLCTTASALMPTRCGRVFGQNWLKSEAYVTPRRRNKSPEP